MQRKARGDLVLGLFLVSACAGLSACGGEHKTKLGLTNPWTKPDPVYDQEKTQTSLLVLNSPQSVANCAPSASDCGAAEPSGCAFNKVQVDQAGVKLVHADFLFTAHTDGVLSLSAFHRHDYACHIDAASITCPSATLTVRRTPASSTPTGQGPLGIGSQISVQAGYAYTVHAEVQNVLKCEHVDFGFALSEGLVVN